MFTKKKNKTCFVKSSDSGIKNLVTNALPENTKKSTKYVVHDFEGEESYLQVDFKIMDM